MQSKNRLYVDLCIEQSKEGRAKIDREIERVESAFAEIWKPLHDNNKQITPDKATRETWVDEF